MLTSGRDLYYRVDSGFVSHRRLNAIFLMDRWLIFLGRSGNEERMITRVGILGNEGNGELVM